MTVKDGEIRSVYTDFRSCGNRKLLFSFFMTSTLILGKVTTLRATFDVAFSVVVVMGDCVSTSIA